MRILMFVSRRFNEQIRSLASTFSFRIEIAASTRVREYASEFKIPR